MVWSTQGGSRTLTGVAHGALDAARLPFRHLDVIPGQGVEPRPPRSERGVLPVRRSRSVRLRPARHGLDANAPMSCAVLGERAEPPMSMPLAYPSTLDRRPQACTSAGAASSWRGFGAGASCVSEKSARNSKRECVSAISSAERRGVFLSQAGPRFELELVQAEHHLSRVRRDRLRNDEGDPCGSPSTGSVYG
jgi:hypothetical protein